MGDNDKNEEVADKTGALLHTALRKCCDSKESSYLWNIIHLLDPTWTAFCKAVVEAGATTGEELKKVAEDVSSWWPPGDIDRKVESHYARTIFRIALEDFGEDDEGEWAGFACYLGGQGG